MSEKESMKTPRAYYVSPQGNDTYDGTRQAAFKTIQRVNQLRINAGDSILFEGGKEFTGNLILGSEKSGDADHLVHIGSFGNGIARILAGNGSAVSIQQTKWISIYDLSLVGSGRQEGNTKDGVSILKANHILLKHLDISGFQKSGLHVDFSSDITAENLFSHDNGSAGISVGGKNLSKKSNQHIRFAYCRAENNPGDPTNFKNHSGNGIVVGSCTDVLIEYCTATNNGWAMPRKGNGPVGIWAFEADSITIEHCLSYRNKTSEGGDDGGGFDFDGGVTHSVIQYCLSYENQGAGYCMFQYKYASSWHDNIYRFNISINDGLVSPARAGIFIWNSSLDSSQFSNNLFYNNTIWNAKEPCIHYDVYSTRKGFAFYNNIFATKDGLIKGDKGSDVFIGNQQINTQNFEDQMPELKYSDKRLPESAESLKNFTDYRLSENSLLRNKGVNLLEVLGIHNGGLDFNGGIPSPKSVGASF